MIRFIISVRPVAVFGKQLMVAAIGFVFLIQRFIHLLLEELQLHLLIPTSFMLEWVKQKCEATFLLVMEFINQMMQGKHGSISDWKILMPSKTFLFIRRILTWYMHHAWGKFSELVKIADSIDQKMEENRGSKFYIKMTAPVVMM